MIQSALAVTIFGLAILPVLAQAPAAGAGGGQAAPPAETPKTNNMTPLAVTDLRFDLRNISVDKRIDPNGQGEILDVSYDLFNRSPDPVNLKAYFIAYYEENARNDAGRELIPYPEWRDKDPATSTYLVQSMHIVPGNPDPKAAWAPDDEVYKQYHYIANRLRKDIVPDFPETEVLPPAWLVVDYLAGKPAEGLAFTLPGTKGPGNDPAKRYLNNYRQETEEEKKAGLKPQFHEHSYTMEFAQRRAIIRTHHFSRYRADFKLYNRYAIVLFDADAIKSHEEDTSADKKPVSPIYFRTFSVNRPIKLY